LTFTLDPLGLRTVVLRTVVAFLPFVTVLALRPVLTVDLGALALGALALGALALGALILGTVVLIPLALGPVPLRTIALLAGFTVAVEVAVPVLARLVLTLAILALALLALALLTGLLLTLFARLFGPLFVLIVAVCAVGPLVAILVFKIDVEAGGNRIAAQNLGRRAVGLDRAQEAEIVLCMLEVVFRQHAVAC
jgi:hypothetical protein